MPVKSYSLLCHTYLNTRTFSLAISMGIFSSVQLYLQPKYVYNITAVSSFKSNFPCFYSSNILVFVRTTCLSFCSHFLSHHSEYFAKSCWFLLYNRTSSKNKPVPSLTPCGWNLCLSSDCLSSQVPKLLLTSSVAFSNSYLLRPQLLWTLSVKTISLTSHESPR